MPTQHYRQYSRIAIGAAWVRTRGRTFVWHGAVLGRQTIVRSRMHGIHRRIDMRVHIQAHSCAHPSTRTHARTHACTHAHTGRAIVRQHCGLSRPCPCRAARCTHSQHAVGVLLCAVCAQLMGSPPTVPVWSLIIITDDNIIDTPSTIVMFNFSNRRHWTGWNDWRPSSTRCHRTTRPRLLARCCHRTTRPRPQ